MELGSLLACVVEPWVLATYLSHVTEDVAKSNGVKKGFILATGYGVHSSREGRHSGKSVRHLLRKTLWSGSRGDERWSYIAFSVLFSLGPLSMEYCCPLSVKYL